MLTISVFYAKLSIMKNKNKDDKAYSPNANSDIAFELASIEKPSRDKAYNSRQEALSVSGLARISKKRESKRWDAKAQRDSDHAEKILGINQAEYIRKLTNLFKDKVPGFNESEGLWPDENNGVGVRWKTDPSSGQRTIHLTRVESIEPGMGYRHSITWSGNEAPTEVSLVFRHLEDGQYKTSPNENTSYDLSSINTELIASYETWTQVLTDPDSIWRKYLDSPEAAA